MNNANPIAASVVAASPKVIVPSWIRSLSRIWLLVAVIGTLVMVYVPKAMGAAPSEFTAILFICSIGSFVMSSIMLRKTVSRETLAIALFIGLGPIGLLLFLVIKDQLRAAPAEQSTSPLSNAATSQTMPVLDTAKPTNKLTASPGKLVFCWLVTTLLGVVVSSSIKPQGALEMAHNRVLENSLLYPLLLMGIWALQMLANLILGSRRKSMRRWGLSSSASFICLAFGYFWATVLRMPTPQEDVFITPAALINMATLPTMIWLMYCWYVSQQLKPQVSEKSTH